MAPLQKKIQSIRSARHSIAKKYHKTYLPNVLKRIRSTRSQGHLSAQDRKRNVTNAFKVTKSTHIHNKCILLVDDVLTTGATANECAKVLLRAGATYVYLLTFAATVKN